MSSKSVKSFIATFLTLISFASAQPFVPSEEYEAALDLREQGETTQAIASFSEIATQNAQTQLGGFAKYQIYDITSRYLNDSDAAISILEEIVGEYEGTPVGISAQLALVDERYFFQLDQWLPEMEIVIESIGGAPIDSVFDGSGKIELLPDWRTEDQYWALTQAYNNLAARLRMESDRDDDELATILFMRGAIRIPDMDKYTGELLQHIALESQPDHLPYTNPARPDDTTSPILQLVSPTHGQNVTVGSSLLLELRDGDFLQSGVNLSTIELLVDGSDLTVRALVKSTVQIENILTEGQEREVLRVNLTIDSSIPAGPHQGLLRCRDWAGNQSELPFSFIVAADEPTSVTLPTTQDSTLRAKKPNRNEGANPRLFLSHRLEARGKSQNPIVGFDLANEDLTGLTRATLVMNVQDCDLPRRWGNDGRYIIACPVNEPWVEGNGNKYRVNGGNGKTKGQGQGVTWFSPVDNKIQNNRPNGSLQWDGARSVTGQPTAPPVLLVNDQTGPVEFDVTDDVLAGYQDGWVLKKQDESKFGNIRFYSKEGGSADVAPKLILEFGDSLAKTNEAPADGVLAKLGFGRGKFESKPTGSELPSFRERLQESPVAAYAGETLVGAMAGPNPALKMASKVAYRTWLEQGLG